MSSLVIYVYKEDGNEVLKNLQYFLEHGLIKNSHYIFVINNYHCSLSIPASTLQIPITVLRFPNNYDLVSWKRVIFEYVKVNLLLTFDYVYFLNSTCRGPFIPIYVKDNWQDIFRNRLLSTNSDACAPINHNPWSAHKTYDVPFLHSYMFVLTKKAMTYLLSTDFFSHITPEMSRGDVVMKGEVRMSSLLLKGNMRITSLVIKYKDADWLRKEHLNNKQWVYKNYYYPCPEVPMGYDGCEIHPLEVVFFKNVRNCNENRPRNVSGISSSMALLVDNYTRWFSKKN